MTSSTDRGSSDQTRTYVRANSVVFLKTDEAFGGLSNMAGGYPLHVQGARILTSEALYQACRFPHLPEVQRLIIEQKSPMAAKMKSKPHRKNSRPDWDRVRVKIMRWCLRVKLVQNWASFSELLLRTDDRPIVEESRQDDFWGAKPVDEHTLVGMNVLGRQLMELREAIKVGGRDAFGRVEPPGIPAFLLFGRPIETISGRGAQTAELVATQSKHSPGTDAGRLVAAQPSLFDQPTVEEGRPPKYLPERSEHAGIRNLKPYPRMKDSGVPWLGEVPEHWEARKLRHVLRQVTVRNRPNLPLLSVVREKGVILRDVSNGAENHNFIPDDLSNYKVVCSGQFAMNKMKAWQGSYGVSRYDGIVSPAYFVFDIAGVGGDYFHAAMRSRAYVPFFTQASDGVRIGQWDLSQARMRGVPFFVPPLPEQAGIVRFLDHVDRRIRRYIRTKWKLITLLEEQKQTVIHRAVTRGLAPDVHLKPSGVEWLGDVPEHWEVMSLGVAASVQTGPFGSQLHASEYVTGGTPVINPSHMREESIDADPKVSVRSVKAAELDRHKLFAGDVVAARRGELGRCALVVNGQEGWLCGTGSLRIRPRCEVLLPGYLVQVLSSFGVHETLTMSSIGATMDNLNASMMARLRIPMPPLQEQSAITEHIARKSLLIRSASLKAQREISLLREYRTRLIADVVTGKLDVREAAARLAQEAEEPELLDDAGALAEDISEETEAADPDAALEEAEA